MGSRRYSRGPCFDRGGNPKVSQNGVEIIHDGRSDFFRCFATGTCKQYWRRKNAEKEKVLFGQGTKNIPRGHRKMFRQRYFVDFGKSTGRKGSHICRSRRLDWNGIGFEARRCKNSFFVGTGASQTSKERPLMARGDETGATVREYQARRVPHGPSFTGMSQVRTVASRKYCYGAPRGAKEQSRRCHQAQSRVTSGHCRRGFSLCI
mmetsp:Transcript_18007/g.39258  ORF Transcript_18007/g.39258 Transcript_18007/m.39258 type:complete len:206 (-) Transcript_18007:850-1467(-)